MLSDASSKGLDWSCPTCRSFGSELKGLKSLILQLQSELRELKGNRTDAFPSDPLQFEEIVEEVNKRNLRKSNVIIFGLDEVNQEEPPENRSARDGVAVSKVFRAIDSEFDVPNIKPIRLGSFRPGSNRPVKIVLRNEDEVRRIISKAKTLRSHKDFKNKKIYLSYDRTPRQVEYYKQLKQELEVRKQAGEMNLKIKYVNGIPKIVSN
nr:unnamed protein product [Callosobruchus analis]